MDWLFVVALALASSIDNLAVAFSYGLSGLRIGVAANLMIALVCLLMSITGVYFGVGVGRMLPGAVPGLIGAGLLLLLGIRVLWMVLHRSERAPEREVKSTVGLREALLLGISLSANAMVNSMGGGIIGMSPLVVSLAAALGSFAAIAVGTALGSRARGLRTGRVDLGRYASILGGSLLIALAVAKVIR